MATKPLVPQIEPVEQKKTDLVMTPDHLARQIVEHFGPYGICLDPFKGGGAFFSALCDPELCYVPTCRIVKDVYWCEIDLGHDFFAWDKPVNWIVSNPPYSIFSDVLEHSFRVAEHIVYLIQTPAAFFTKRLNIAQAAGFGIREIYRVSCPPEWKQAGLSFGTGLAAVHWQKGYQGPIFLTDGRRGSCSSQS